MPQMDIYQLYFVFYWKKTDLEDNIQPHHRLLRPANGITRHGD